MTASIDPRRAVGNLGEQIAADHLARAGYVILARNFRTRFGELDLVAADERCIVFCEVKARIAGTRRGPSGPAGPRRVPAILVFTSQKTRHRASAATMSSSPKRVRKLVARIA